MAIDSTVGGASAVSYVSVAAADTYFATRVNADVWTAPASTPNKEAALVTATNRLEQERWQGEKAATTQRLAWPRTDTFDPDGNEYASDAIPLPIQQATFELALALLQNPSSADGNALEQFKSIGVGPVSLETRANATASGRLPAAVSRLISGLSTSSPGTFRVERT